MESMQHDDGSGLIAIFLIGSRWIHFASIFVLFGSSFFWFYIGRGRSSVGPDGLPHTLRVTVILLNIAVFVAALSGIAWFAGVLASMTNGFSNIVDPETLRQCLMETQFGPVSILRLSLLLIAALSIFLPMRDRVRFMVLVWVGALLLISQAWLGHAAEGGAGLYGALMIIAYGAHLLAAAAWVGGLLPLLLALAEVQNVNARDRHQSALVLLLRYSLMATVAVALIVISGIINAGFVLSARSTSFSIPTTVTRCSLRSVR